MRRETADAVIDAVDALGLNRVSVAFIHVAEEHPFTVFDQAQAKGRGAYGPKRGQAVELSNHEWLVSMTGREQINAQFQGLPDPVLLRLHERSTFRDMRTLAKQAAGLRVPFLADVRNVPSADHAAVCRRDRQTTRGA